MSLLVGVQLVHVLSHPVDPSAGRRGLVMPGVCSWHLLAAFVLQLDRHTVELQVASRKN